MTHHSLLFESLNQAALENPTRRNLQRLFLLRTVMIVFMLTSAFALFYLHIPLPKLPISMAVGGMLLLNLFTLVRLTKRSHVSEREVFFQLLADLVFLTALFYFTGGYSNPLVWMYLLPLTVAAVALKRQDAWLLASVAIGAYSFLVFFYVPLSHLHMHDIAGVTLDIHLVGMWLGFVVSAGIIAFFVTRIGQSLRDYDHIMAAIREKSLESERVLALGTLATSAAHELGTPLATMAVVSKELANALVDNPEQHQQLEVLRTQIHRCKEILSSITRDAGLSRAEAGNSLPLRHFLNIIIARWRDTRPATELNVTLCEHANNPTVNADRTLIQAIQNLLDNAADASPAHLLFDADWNQSTLTLRIRDFGHGISDDVKKHLGKPFFSAKHYQGMGLGVYLTQITLERFGGMLHLDNHPEGGAITTVTIPLNSLSPQP